MTTTIAPYLFVSITILWFALRWYKKPSVAVSKTSLGTQSVAESQIEPLYTFDWSSETPLAVYTEPYLKSRKFVLTMGVQKCDINDIMLIDANYRSRMAERRRILIQHEKDTLACLPGTEHSCAEALHMISCYLVQRYPTIFEVIDASKRLVLNKVTGERVETDLRGVAALKAVSQLSEEDVLLLQYNPAEQVYFLRAAIAAFPNGFSFIDKVGKSLSDIHIPVPTYAQRLKRSMDRYFHRIEVNKPVVRYNWGITAHSNLFSTSGTHMHDHDSLETVKSDVTIEDCHIRCERQVLQRLRNSGDLLFTVKTYLFKLTEVAADPGVARNLRGAVRGLQGELGYYKGKPRWEHVVLPYLDAIIGNEEDDIGHVGVESSSNKR